MPRIAWPSPNCNRLVAICLLAAAAPGCSFVPRSRYEDCHKLSRTLQSQVVQLRDSEGRLRSQNQDLVDRALIDQRRIGDLEEYTAKQDRILTQYQEDRERLASELDRVIRVVRTPGGVPLALNERLSGFAEAHPGTTLNESGDLCTLPTARLFVPGSAVLTPLGKDWLADLAAALGDFGRVGAVVAIASPAAPDEGVVRTSLPQAGGGTDGTPLEAARAETIRAQLLKATGAGDRGVVLADGDPATEPGRIAIRVELPGPGTAALDDGEPRSR